MQFVCQYILNKILKEIIHQGDFIAEQQKTRWERWAGARSQGPLSH